MDKSPVVASAALVSALHLLSNNTEIVKRWINEIQEAAQNKNNMVQVSLGDPGLVLACVCVRARAHVRACP